MRRVDAMVAEMVMGYQVVALPTAGEHPRRPYVAIFPDGSSNVYVDNNNHWSPSTSIAAAWEVVEKMRADGCRFTVDEWEGNARVPKGLMVVFRRNTRTYAGIHESLSLAICEAALRAVGVPESEITAATEGER